MTKLDELFEGPLDIVGDIHGQYGAMQDLLGKLQYRPDGSHPDGRRLVFVGDLVDRGPDSPAVVEQVMSMVNSGHAQCVMGNHELNILRCDQKLDNQWFFGNDSRKRSRERPASAKQKDQFHEFFSQLPLALEREDIRVIHACWHSESITWLKNDASRSSDVVAEYQRFRREANERLHQNGDLALYEIEKRKFDEKIRYGDNDPLEHWPDHALLPGYATVDELRQMENPVAVLTSGEERTARKTYPAGRKFRFVDRVAWWDKYQDEQAVVIGHYWRLYNDRIPKKPRASSSNLFSGIGPDQWLGAKKKVFCVDFSVAGRANAHSATNCRLAAVRWPEATLMFDDGEELDSDYDFAAKPNVRFKDRPGFGGHL